MWKGVGGGWVGLVGGMEWIGATPTVWEPSWKPRSVNGLFFNNSYLFYLRDVFVCGRVFGIGVFDAASTFWVLFWRPRSVNVFFNFFKLLLFYYLFKGRFFCVRKGVGC